MSGILETPATWLSPLIVLCLRDHSETEEERLLFKPFAIPIPGYSVITATGIFAYYVHQGKAYALSEQLRYICTICTRHR
jgi:hypothetical protein